MGNLSGFDAKTVEPSSFDVLPAGDYEICIVGSCMQMTKKGDGKYLSLELQVLGGPHKGRKLFDNLNLMNPSPKAVEIAKGTLSAICRAVGVLTPNDSSELHDKPLRAAVDIEDDQQFGRKNRVKGYKPLSGSLETATAKAETIQSLKTAGPPSLDDLPF